MQRIQARKASLLEHLHSLPMLSAQSELENSQFAVMTVDYLLSNVPNHHRFIASLRRGSLSPRAVGYPTYSTLASLSGLQFKQFLCESA